MEFVIGSPGGASHAKVRTSAEVIRLRGLRQVATPIGHAGVFRLRTGNPRPSLGAGIRRRMDFFGRQGSPFYNR